jgi:large subunit ribosomal protein L25
MASTTLNAKPREGSGKGAARSLRREGQVPAIIYGHHREPQSISVDARELGRLLEHISAGSTVVELSIGSGSGSARTLIREIQRHPVRKHNILHVDFQELVAGEKVTVSVPLVFVNTEATIRATGGILDQIMHELEIEVDPSAIPNHVDVDVTGLTIGHSLHVSDIKLPEGVEVLDDPEATVCVLSAPRASETPAAGVEVVAAAAEPELIRKTKDEEGEE